MRTFTLKDDCTLSGRRLHRDERRVEGGGYVDPMGGALLPAHGGGPGAGGGDEEGGDGG